mgnify:CR=1 FL=1
MEVKFNGTPGDYTYAQGQYGKSAEGIVSVGPQSERNGSVQQSAGGNDREAGDHGGHLIAHSLGGKNDEVNIDAQAANVNQIDQRSAERNVANLAQDTSNTVYMGVTNFTRSESERPDATMMTIGVQNSVSGMVDIETMSFTNASHKNQAAWNQTAIENEGVDSRQDVGMTAEQRSIANERSGVEDYVDDRVGSGWQVTHFDNSEYMGSVSAIESTETVFSEYMGALESNTQETSSEDEYSGNVETSISTECDSQGEDDSISMD